MKKLLNLKIAAFLLVLGYSLPTHSMTRLTSCLERIFAPFQAPLLSNSFPEVNTPKREVIAYNPQTDISTIIESYRRFVAIKLVTNMYTKDGATYGNELGQAVIKWPNHLAEMHVHPYYRNQGYGEQLFNATAQYCQDQKSSTMKWEAEAYVAYDNDKKSLKQNQLVAWYKKLGGKTTDDVHFIIDLPLKNIKQPSSLFLYF